MTNFSIVPYAEMPSTLSVSSAWQMESDGGHLASLPQVFNA
jgi:hypothetical protein